MSKYQYYTILWSHYWELKKYKQRNENFSGNTDFRKKIISNFWFPNGKFPSYITYNFCFLLYLAVSVTFLNYRLIFMPLAKRLIEAKILANVQFTTLLYEKYWHQKKRFPIKKTIQFLLYIFRRCYFFLSLKINKIYVCRKFDYILKIFCTKLTLWFFLVTN